MKVQDNAMKVFVKECKSLSLEQVRFLFKPSVTLSIYNTDREINLDDVVVVSSADEEANSNELSDYNVLIYENVFKEIIENINKEFCENYDYYHLLYNLNKSKNPDITTIVSGSSYGLFGFEALKFENSLNLSLASQDLYYAVKGIDHVFKTNKNIRNIVMFMSYYYFYSDLSKTKNDYEIRRVSKVYKRLFDDEHNCYLLPPRQSALYSSRLFDIDKLLQMFVEKECTKGYFNKCNPRENFATKLWSDKTKKWIELTDAEKALAGKSRADSHNTSLKRLNSLLQNTVLMQKFVNDYQGLTNIYIVIPPATKYYKNHFSSEFRDMFYNVLEVVKDSGALFEVMDFWDDEAFSDDDFNDMDHLNEQGAAKLTCKIKVRIQ